MRVTYPAVFWITSLAIFLYAACVQLTLLYLNDLRILVLLWIASPAREALHFIFIVHSRLESPEPAGFHVSLVCISESSSQFTTDDDYKIDHISKTKDRKKYSLTQKSASEHFVSFWDDKEIIF